MHPWRGQSKNLPCRKKKGGGVCLKGILEYVATACDRLEVYVISSSSPTNLFNFAVSE